MNAQTKIPGPHLQMPRSAYMVVTNAYRSDAYSPEQQQMMTSLDDVQDALSGAIDNGLADRASIWSLDFQTGRIADVTSETLSALRGDFFDDEEGTYPDMFDPLGEHASAVRAEFALDRAHIGAERSALGVAR